MLLSSPTRVTRASATRFASPPTYRLPFRSNAFASKQPFHRPWMMFQRAINKAAVTAPAPSASATSDGALKQQIFPSSSPSFASRQLSQIQQRNNGVLPHQPALLGDRHHAAPFQSAYTKSAVKRTYDGLAKALGDNGRDAFQDITNTERRAFSTPNEDFFFDEDDFDSDLDLDVEDRLSKSKSAISYPRLPVTRKDPTPVTYPPLNKKSKYHTEATDSHGHSPFHPKDALPLPSPGSSAVPWSSSPPSHFGEPPKPQIEGFSAYALKGYITEKPLITAPKKPFASIAEDEPRPSKRRTLPWLDVQGQADTQMQYTSKTVTPLPKNTPSSKYPWNTTASAVKEQQKQFRKANKKAVKEHDSTEESRDAAIAAKKSRTVARPLLSNEQRQVLNLVVDSGRSVFFTGSAGTGKSVLLREIIAVLRKKYSRESDRVAITASTGLAACNIGGVTLHSFAGIGLGKEEVPELVKKIKRNQKAKHRWMRTKVLVVDEVSMVDGDLFDKLEAVARTLRNNGRPFGGIQLVITGDFFQLPPVPDSYNATSTFAFDAKSWGTAIDHTIGLHHVFRQKDPVFAGMLNEMREGRLTKDSIETFKKLSRAPEVGDQLSLTLTELFPTRVEVESANRIRMQQLNGNEVRYLAKDSGALPDEQQRSKLLDNSLAPRELVLKKGAQVMLIKNMDETLVNGSLGKVVGFMSEQQMTSYMNDHDTAESTVDVDQTKVKFELLRGSTIELWPVVRFAIADGTTRDLLCVREEWKTELPNGEIQAKRSQVPLILAWALSIHKAQGQTLDRVKVDLGKVFEKGQAYVALSRATSIQGLQVLRFDASKVQAHPKVRTFYSNLTRAENASRED